MKRFRKLHSSSEGRSILATLLIWPDAQSLGAHARIKRQVKEYATEVESRKIHFLGGYGIFLGFCFFRQVKIRVHIF